MTWSQNAVDQLVVGNPQAQHVYIGPGDGNGNEGVFLYGPDGKTVLAAFDIAGGQAVLNVATINAGTVNTAGYLAVNTGTQTPAEIKYDGGPYNAVGLHGGLDQGNPNTEPSISVQSNSGGLIIVNTPAAGAYTLFRNAVQVAGGLKVTGGITETEFRSARTGRSGTSDNFSAGSMVALGSVSLPAGAPAGAYSVSLCCPISSSSACNVYYRVTAPSGANLTADDVRPIAANTRYPYNWSDVFQHAGGAGTFASYVQVTAGTGTVYNASWHLAVAYLGS